MAKKSSTSAAEMEALLVHAVVQTKARTGEGDAEAAAARELGVHLLGVVKTMPALRTWRGRSEAGAQVAVVTFADAATAAERERFSSGAHDLEAAQRALVGVLPVQALTRARNAFSTDLWTTGTAKDLSALGWPVRRRLEFSVAVAKALASLHAVGLAHGALCADNVLLDDELAPVISEAGLVSLSALMQRKDAALYEPFAAPEVRQGDPPDVRSDVFSAGKVIHGFFTDAELPAGVREVLDLCAMPAPLRHPDAAALATSLQAALDAIPVEAPPKPLEARPLTKRDARQAEAAPALAAPNKNAPRTPWKPPLGLGLAGIVLMVGCAAVAVFVGRGNDLSGALVTWGLPLGAAMASTLAPPLPKQPMLARIGLALGLVGLILVIDPIHIAFRMAAQAHMQGDDAARRRAVDEVLTLGRDFRGLSLAGLNLTGLDMTGVDLRRVNLSGADLTGVRLFAAEVDGASFDAAQLAGADLQQTALELASVGSAHCDALTRLPPTFTCVGARLERKTAVPLP